MALHDTKFARTALLEARPASIGGSVAFWSVKYGFDVVVSLLLLPLLAVVCVVLVFVNPWLNPGPVFFVQIRMGQNCRPFRAYKIRTMRAATSVGRGAHDPVEFDRIPELGHLLRRTRLDELPQVLNVLKGEMSLIGPRPDFFSHAKVYLRTIPGYRARHRVRPGISGLAQVEIGYAIAEDTVRRKAQADNRYIQNAGYKLETVLVFKTIRTVLKGLGM